MPRKQIHLGVFSQDVGHHIAAWRHPEVPAGGGVDFDFHRAFAARAEEGKLDFVFFGDQMAAMYPEDESVGGTSRVLRLEPIALLGALAAVTRRIGLVATASMTYYEPFHIARKFATLDQISRGRTGWNMVTSFEDAEARNFNLSAVSPPELRYRRAAEFVDVVKALWESWEADAFLRDKATGRFFDPSKLHLANHSGPHFSSRGPLNVPRSPQGRPVLVQAGASEHGRAFAAAHAELIFSAQPDLAHAKAFADDIRERAIAPGRQRTQLRFMPGLMCFIGRSEDEAREKYERLQALITPEVGWMVVGKHLGVDISKLPLDQPLPPLSTCTGHVSRQQQLIEAAVEDRLTVRQFYQRYVGTRGHRAVIGTAARIADEMEEWVDSGACDGFNLMVPWAPGGLDDIVDLLVPELRRRSRFRSEYSGVTLRDHLGMPF